MPVDARLAQHFIAEVGRLFGFLYEEHGFAGPITEMHNDFHYMIVRFTGREVAVDCVLETRSGDENVGCVLARVTPEGVATEWLPPGASPCRAHLTALLDGRGARYKLRTVGGLTLERNITVGLEDFARLLREYAPDVLAGSAAIFEPASAKPR